MEKKITNFGEKTVTIYVCDNPEAPIVFSNDYGEEAEAVLAACETLGCPAFHLVSITGLHWDEELSSWPEGSIVSKEDHFTGGADAYLKQLEEEIIPYVKSVLTKSSSYLLNGYSMGGLFALYAAYRSDCFDAYAAPSGSVWYPDFVEFARTHEFVRKPSAIYLSLGDRESRTRHAVLSQTETNMEILRDLYREQNIPTIFELNKGNHFKDTDKRVAKGIQWLLEQPNNLHV